MSRVRPHLDGAEHNLTKARRWSRQIIGGCYNGILVNMGILALVWSLLLSDGTSIPASRYFLHYVLLPAGGIALVIFVADRLTRMPEASFATLVYAPMIAMLLFCAYLCLVHGVASVLLVSFVIPIMLSTVYADTRATRNVLLMAMALMLLCSFLMGHFSTRDFGRWLSTETLVASALLIAAYLLSRVLIVYGQDVLIVQRDHSKLEEENKRDPLTQLYNRRAWQLQLPQMIHDCQATGLPLSLAQIDLDDFKHINDVYGHAVGDDVLLRLAELLRFEAPRDTSAYRYGGEEFLLVFKGWDARQAARSCEDLLSALSASTFSVSGLQRITFSCGVAQMDEELDNLDSLYLAADAALYQAKQRGKDQIRVYGTAD